MYVIKVDELAMWTVMNECNSLLSRKFVGEVIHQGSTTIDVVAKFVEVKGIVQIMTLAHCVRQTSPCAVCINKLKASF